MLLNGLRFSSLMLGALNLGLAWAHLVEMEPKRAMSGRDWLTTQQTYRQFGNVASVTVPGALLSMAAMSYLVRERRVPAVLAGIGAACTAATVAIWATRNKPVNREVVTWDPDALPTDWESRRDQWEFAHATSAGLHALGFGALAAAALYGNGG